MCAPLARERRPLHLIGRRAHRCAERRAVEQELHAGHADVVGRGRTDDECTAHGGAGRRSHESNRWRRRVIHDRHADRDAGRDMAGRVSRHGRNRVRAVDRACGGPLRLVGSIGIGRAQRRAIQQELHAGHPDVVGGRRGNRDRAVHRRSRRRTRERHSRCGQVIEDSDSHRLGCRLAPGAVARHGGPRVHAICRSRCRPNNLIGRLGIGLAKRRAVEQELHAGHADVVGRRRDHCDRAMHGRPRGRTRQEHRRRRQVVPHIHDHRRRHGFASGRVARHRGQRVCGISRARGRPLHLIRRRAPRVAERRTVEQELHARDANVVDRRRGNRDRAVHGRSRGRTRQRHRRRRQVVPHIHNHRRRGGFAPGGVAGDRRQRMGRVSGASGFPRHLIRRLAHGIAERRAIHHELHARDAHVIRDGRADRHDSRNGGAGLRYERPTVGGARSFETVTTTMLA